MAMNRPDRNIKIMKEEFGTVCLITDPKANRYLDRASNFRKGSIPEESLSRWCGGRGGFDIYSERLYE